MVTQLGMSEELGSVDLSSDYADLSSETKMRIEHEVRRMVEEGRDRASQLLTRKRKELDLVAKGLVEYETLNKDEMERVIRGEKLPHKMLANATAPMLIPSILPSAFGSGVPGDPASERST